jgi:cell division protein FtsI/penicillin-binding protein 2
MRVRRVVAVLTTVAVVAATAACTGDDSSTPSGSGDVTSPDGAAQALADALVSGDFAAVGFTDSEPQAVAQEYAATVEGLEGLTPTVTVADVGSPSGSRPTATATFDWTWPIGADGWTYSSQATFSELHDEWLADWDVAAIEPSLHESVTLDLVSLRPQRGDILGAGGLALVTDRPVVRVGIDRTKVGDARVMASARDLARLVGIDVAAYAKRVEASGPLAFVEAIVYRQDEVPRGVLSGVRHIKGGAVLAGELPLAPTKGFASQILGSVGEVTAEMIEENPEFHVGDVAGLSGLQERYDAQLRGTPGQAVNAVGSDGKTRELFRVDAVDGQPLQLTMDERVQIAAEEALADTPPFAALVAIRPSTGEILAAAHSPGTPINVATYGQYAPGSTFKSVSSLALLRAGETPDTLVPCTSSIVVEGKLFENYDDYPASGLGNIPLRTAVANSCNTAFISQRGRLGRRDLVDAAASLGMGVDHDLGFPAYFGNVISPNGETDRAAQLIGQGTILASPMVMATVIASIQAGRLVVPSLVTSVTSGPPDGVSGPGPAEAEALRSMLRGVVTSGSGSFLLDVPGPPVIAKTGTAEYDAGAAGNRTHAWMIAAQGDLAVAVFVVDGVSGSRTAGPILEEFLRAVG